MQHGIVTLRARRRGVTLIEAVLFISIALGLIVGGLIFFQQASLAQRTNDAVRTLSSIASETRALYQSQDNFDGLRATVLNNAGAVPASVNNGVNFTHEWADDAGIFGTDATGLDEATPSQYFMIVYENIPTSACTRLAQATDGSGPIGNGIVAINVSTERGAIAAIDDANNPGDLTAFTAADQSVPLAAAGVTVTPAAAAAACGTSGTVNVGWVLTR